MSAAGRAVWRRRPVARLTRKARACSTRATPPEAPVMNLLIDCDPGMDDAIALMLAVNCSTGNLPADECTQNARKILDLLKAPDIPVACGAQQPLLRPHAADPFSHGPDGLGGTALPPSPRPIDPRFAPDLIIDMAIANPQLTIVATAPLTNLALAVTKAPHIVQLIEHVYFIGGNFGFNEYAQLYGTGTTPLSEWNVVVAT